MTIAGKSRCFFGKDMLRILLVSLAMLLPGLAVSADPPGKQGQVAVARPVGGDQTRRRLGLLPAYASVPRIKAVKVAILDSGFAGVDGKRPYLPANTIVVENYDPAFVRKHGLGDPAFTRPFIPGETHGRAMAQLVWAMCGNDPSGPQFYLLNANGPTLFRRAIRFAISQKADIILFSGNFEGGGNYDGKGPINAAVDEAIAAGIIWVNAAGNSGGRVYNGPVDIGSDGFVRFRGAPFPSALRFINRFDENRVTVTLTWNDYRQTEDAGTDKDLDLIVEDANGAVVGASRLRQVPADKPAGEGETRNPRERLVLSDLAAVSEGQEYRIRVKANGRNFGPTDRLRILVSSDQTAPFVNPKDGTSADPVEFLDASQSGEIYPPADNSGVLTVGDTSASSSRGPTSDGRMKPDVVLDEATARFSNGAETVGASNAAAYFAGVVAILRAQEPTLTTVHLRAWVRRLDAASTAKRPPPAALPLPVGSRPLPPPPTIPLTPNQRRALNYAERSMNDSVRQKGLPPYIVISSVNGTYLIQPGGKLIPGDAPPTLRRPEPAVVTTPASAVFEKRTMKGPKVPHAPWKTPSSLELERLVQIR